MPRKVKPHARKESSRVTVISEPTRQWSWPWWKIILGESLERTIDYTAMVLLGLAILVTLGVLALLFSQAHPSLIVIVLSPVVYFVAIVISRILE